MLVIAGILTLKALVAARVASTATVTNIADTMLASEVVKYGIDRLGGVALENGWSGQGGELISSEQGGLK